MSKQSSVEWFLNEFSKQIEFTPNSELDLWYKELIPKAKAMHKEEIIETWYESKLLSDYISGNQYYNKTFEK